jgi:hypothetical protein
MTNTWPVQPEVPAGGSVAGLEVAVIHTSVKQTLTALRAAARLARVLGASIRMVVPEVVPFPAPLEQPLVETAFAARKFRTIAAESKIDTTVKICLCRDWEAGVLQSVPPDSFVIVGTTRSWWRSRRERRVARMLRAHGHHVILSESE